MKETNPCNKELSFVNVFLLIFLGIITYIQGAPTPKRVWQSPPTPNSCFYFVNLTSCEINNQQAEFDRKNRGMILNELKHLRRSKGFESTCKTR